MRQTKFYDSRIRIENPIVLLCNKRLSGIVISIDREIIRVKALSVYNRWNFEVAFSTRSYDKDTIIL